LGLAQIIPGPIGWVSLAAQTAYDVEGHFNKNGFKNTAVQTDDIFKKTGRFLSNNSGKRIKGRGQRSEGYLMEQDEESDILSPQEIGKELFADGLPEDKNEFIKTMGTYLTLQGVNPEFLSILLLSIGGQQLSPEQEGWVKENAPKIAEMMSVKREGQGSEEEDDVNESVVYGSKKRILREIKQPVLIEATPKTTKLKGYRPNFKGKFSPQNTPDVTASKKSDEAVEGYNTSRLAWTAKDKFWKGYETTEKMNVIFDRVGFGDQYFDRVVAENILDNKKKAWRMQEHLNMLAHQKAMREVYGVTESPFRNIEESETYDNKVKDPLFTKVASRLKKEIDYPKKPSPKGYPSEAPPKIDPNTGMHPKYGKRYKYDKLDPQSAEAMPMQGDPEIDANIQRLSDKKAKARKLKNLMGKK